MPTDEFSRRPTTNDVSKWKTFSGGGFPMQFKYPPELELRIEKGPLGELSMCGSSQSIWLGFQYRDSSWDTVTERFASLVTIFLTTSPFDSIAKAEGFERDEIENDVHEGSVHDEVSSWRISGESAHSEAAAIHLGTSWHGLRGHSYKMVDWKTHMHDAVVDFQKSLLVLDRKPQCSIVCKFYQGPTDAPLDEPPFELCEATFYKIVSTVSVR